MTAPDKIWIAGFLDECGEYYQSAVEAEGDHGGTAVEYARITPDTITLPRAEVEALMGAAEAGLHRDNCPSVEFSGGQCDCGRDDVLAALATLQERMK